MSETSKYRHLTTQYCYRSDGQPGCGVDIASQGDNVVPWAMGLDLPFALFNSYCGGEPAKGPIQLRGQADALPFETETLDFVYSSHFLEDLPRKRWPQVMSEWKRVLKPGGYMIILVPEVTRWNSYLAAGGMGNPAHSIPEPSLGDLSVSASEIGLDIILEVLTNLDTSDYTILGVFRVPV